MMDDITLDARVPEAWRARGLIAEGGHVRLAKQPDLGGQMCEEQTLQGPGIALSFCADSGRLRLRCNVNRLFLPAPSVNFPLRSVESLDDLPLERIARFLMKSFRVRPIATEIAALVRSLGRLRVAKVAYPIDVFVGEERVQSVLDGLEGVRRKHRSGGQSFRSQTAATTGVQFGSVKSRGPRVQIYDKAAQLRGEHEPVRQVQTLPRASDPAARPPAAGILRFEVTLRASAIRAVFRDMPSTLCPTFRLMCDRRVSDFVLRRELERLHLHRLRTVVLPANDAPADLRGLTMRLFAHAHRFNDLMGTAEQPRASTPKVSLVRAMAMGFRWITQEVPPRDLAAMWNGGRSTIAKLDSDLRALGLGGPGGLSLEGFDALHHFVEGVTATREAIWSADLPALPDDVVAAGLACENPWARAAHPKTPKEAKMAETDEVTDDDDDHDDHDDDHDDVDDNKDYEESSVTLENDNDPLDDDG